MGILDFGKKRRKFEDEIGSEAKLTDRTEGGKGGFDLLGTFNESKMKRYKMAMEKKAILFDKEDKDGVDYTHFDFILSTGCSFYRGMSNLEALKLFWKAFYPYLRSITDSYEKFYEQFRTIIDDQEAVLKNHAQLDFKYKWQQEFIKEVGFEWRCDMYMKQKIAAAIKESELKNKGKVVESIKLPDLKEK